MFVVVARKAGPFSASAYALGPDAVLRLPGWFGDFLLTPSRSAPSFLRPRKPLS
ncbi:hypothetical protein [Streptomyces mirabilis]|uniref:hypothetical protein n=1 Tax=Streptomyces mirabilis TaxID=68239 RepID=UPI00371FCB89